MKWIVKLLKNRLLGGCIGLDEIAKRGAQIGPNCKINGHINWGSEPWLITLGNHVELSHDVSLITHDGSTWVFREQERYKNVIRYGKIIIKDNCFIGARTIILPGVTIGPNSIVGAGSVVTKDVLPNMVYAGNPARPICSLDDYAEKCLQQTPDYDLQAYKTDKRMEILRVLE